MASILRNDTDGAGSLQFRGGRQEGRASNAFGEPSPIPRDGLSREVELADRTNTEFPATGENQSRTGLDRIRSRRTSELSRVLNPKENYDGDVPGSEGAKRTTPRRRRGTASSVDGSLPDSPDRPGGRRPRTAPRPSRLGEDVSDSFHPRGAGSRPVATGEVHFVGSIVGASGFPARTTYASWQVEVEKDWGWTHCAGVKEGVTQPSGPSDDEDQLSVWEHPIDLHLKTTTLQRWPRIVLKVFHRSKHNQGDEFYGYTCVNLPTTPGIHEFSSKVWRPNEERSLLSDEYTGYWTGLYPQCVDDTPHELFLRPGWEVSGILTAAMGEVFFRMFVVFKGMQDVSVAGAGAIRRHANQTREGGRRLSFVHDGDAADSPGRSGVRASRSRPRAASVASDDHSSLPGGRHSRQSSLGSHLDDNDFAAGGSPSRPRTGSRSRRSRAGTVSLENSHDLDDVLGSGRKFNGESSAPRARLRSRRSETVGASSELSESRESLPDIGSERLRDRFSRGSK